MTCDAWRADVAWAGCNQSRSGIIMDCVAWYRSDLPGHTVPIG